MNPIGHNRSQVGDDENKNPRANHKETKEYLAKQKIYVQSCETKKSSIAWLFTLIASLSSSKSTWCRSTKLIGMTVKIMPE